MSDEIHRKLDHIIALIMAIAPSHKLPAKLTKLSRKAETPEQTLVVRKEEMIRIFRASGRDLDPGKKTTQNYPTPICGNMDAVPRSILLNRCAQSRFFSPILEAGEINAMDNAIRMLDQLSAEGDLVVKGIHETNLPQNGMRRSAAIVVFSPEQYQKIMEMEIPKDEVEDFPENVLITPKKEAPKNLWVPPVKKPVVEEKKIWTYEPKKKEEVSEKWVPPVKKPQECEKCGCDLDANGNCEGCRLDNEQAAPSIPLPFGNKIVEL